MGHASRKLPKGPRACFSIVLIAKDGRAIVRDSARPLDAFQAS
jgi:hypothetical protein